MSTLSLASPQAQVSPPHTLAQAQELLEAAQHQPRPRAVLGAPQRRPTHPRRNGRATSLKLRPLRAQLVEEAVREAQAQVDWRVRWVLLVAVQAAVEIWPNN